MKPDLATKYLGFELASPIVASASPMTGDLATLARLQEAGAGAVVLPSLFEEQIEQEELAFSRLHELGTETFAEALDYLPELDSYNTGPERYLRAVEEATAELSIPVIASLNGASQGGWVRYAKLIEEAGADALELNVHQVPTDPRTSGAEVEAAALDLVARVRAAIGIPLAVKVAHRFSAFAHFGLQLVESGADGLVLFNRFLRPDLDLDEMRLVPSLALSVPQEMRRPLLWIGILREHTEASLAASTGVHSPDDALKLLLVGADVVMTTSALLRHGPEYVRTLIDGVSTWMEEREYASVAQMKGSMCRAHCPDPSAYERANYMKTLASWAAEPI